MKKKIVLHDTLALDAIRYVGGLDISFQKDDPDTACAYLAVVDLHDPGLPVVYEDFKLTRLTVPYVSGFLGFREAPHLCFVVESMNRSSPYFPQVLLVDGFGVLHHRGVGSASMVALQTQIPTIGVGKTLMRHDGLDEKKVKRQLQELVKVGTREMELKGESGVVHGMALVPHTSKESVKNPIYVSVGSGFTLYTAVQVVKKLCLHRIPEPIRIADIRSKLHF
jgi:deoxyinosine 3'endonuclease (endonuclease V)